MVSICGEAIRCIVILHCKDVESELIEHLDEPKREAQTMVGAVEIDATCVMGCTRRRLYFNLRQRTCFLRSCCLPASADPTSC